MAVLKRNIVALSLSVLLVTGCSSVKMIRNPGESDTGVRFYRPKPYLLVTPADATGRLVNMKLEYLPDFNEEYSAHISGKASVALKDGWNLVGVNTKEAPKDKEEPPAKIEDIKLPPAVVSATNVPIGYYESVYGFAGERKFLQGWRYIGTTVLGGNQPNVCHVPGHTPTCPPNGGPAPGCMSGPLYGLVFFNGVMTFRQLDEIANNQLCPMFVNPTPAESTPSGSGPVIKELQPLNGDPKIQEKTPTPPTPAGSTPPASTSYSMPKPTPVLTIAKPAAAPTMTPAPIPTRAYTAASTTAAPSPSYTLAKPTVAPSMAGSSMSLPPVPPARVAPTVVGKPVAAQGVYVPLAKTTSVPTSTTTSVKAATTNKAAATPSNYNGYSAPSLDQDLFKTGTSLNR